MRSPAYLILERRISLVSKVIEASVQIITQLFNLAWNQKGNQCGMFRKC